MRPNTLALAASAAALLVACGERGPSEEMLEADGEANAPSTEVDEAAARAEFERSGYEELDGSEDEIELPPGGDGDTEEYDPVADQEDGPGGDMVGEDGVARTPGIAGGSAQLSPEQEGLRDVVANERRADDADRDRDRHPVETLAFLGIEPDMTVVEVWPGGGYYTEVIAPYLAEGGGTYYAAGFDPEAGEYQSERVAAFAERYVDDRETYGDVNVTVLSEDGTEVAPDGTADMVLTFRNVHNWMMGGYAEDAFAGFYEALKPGGILGVVEHRLPEAADDAMMESSGYVKTSTVREMAERAGFEFAGASEVNANPADDADHPFGVWTLPPTSRTEGRDGTTLNEVDAERYASIGESDRMTLKFVKPLGADGALME